MKKGLPIIAFVSSVFCLPFFLYSIICIFPMMQWHGFGVDTRGQVYTGQVGKIQVYANRELVNEIPIPKYKTYYFTVQENDTILIADASDVDVYDLSGILLDTYSDPGPDKYNELQWMRTVHNSSGDIYKQKWFFGIRTITKNNETIVYRTPTSNYLLYILSIISFITILITAIVMYVYINTSFQKSNKMYLKKKNNA